MVTKQTLFLALTICASSVFAGPLECVLYYRFSACGIAYEAPQKFDIVPGASGANELWWREACAAPDLAAICVPTNDAAAMAWARAQIRPTEFEHGIAIPDSSATNPVYEIGVENGAVVTWVARASPYDPAVAESNRVAAMAERSTLRGDLRALKGVAQTNKAQVQAVVPWTNGVTAGQQRSDFNDLRRELIDANDTIIELTRLVRQLLKEQNP